MTYPFSLEFNIFYTNLVIGEKERNIQYLLRENYDRLNSPIKSILFDTIEKLDYKYTLLDTSIPTISSIDEKKKLELSLQVNNYSIFFTQTGDEYFTIEELKDISVPIRSGLEEYLEFPIFEPIIYLETNKLVTVIKNEEDSKTHYKTYIVDGRRYIAIDKDKHIPIGIPSPPSGSPPEAPN